MNLKFIDSVSQIWGLSSEWHMFRHFKCSNEKNVFDQTFSGWDCKSQETTYSSKENDHRIAQTATKPNQTLRINS